MSRVGNHQSLLFRRRSKESKPREWARKLSRGRRRDARCESNSRARSRGSSKSTSWSWDSGKMPSRTPLDDVTTEPLNVLQPAGLFISIIFDTRPTYITSRIRDVESALCFQPTRKSKQSGLVKSENGLTWRLLWTVSWVREIMESEFKPVW